MEGNNYTLIPVFVAIAMIPQLLFWWLAPAAATAWLAIYIGGTVLTVGIPVASFLTYWNSNLRKSAGLLLISSILEIAAILLATVLLKMDVSVRSAIFALLIAMLICLIVLIPMISAALKPQRQGIYSVSLAAEPNHQMLPENHDVDRHICNAQSRDPLSPRESRSSSAHKPLPPRNR